MNSNIAMTPGNPIRPRQEDIFEYIAVIMRRWKTFVLAFLAVFIVVALYTFMMKPVYEASATLHVKDDKGKGSLLGELALNTSNPVNAELEILKSRTNAEQVVKRLHLDWQISKKSDGLTFRIIEFSSTAKDPVYDIRLNSEGIFKVKDNDGNLVGEGKSGSLIKGKDFILLLSDLKGEKGDKFTLAQLPFDEVVTGLRSGIKAVEVGRMTSVIKVSYNSTDPVRARDVVNTLVQSYLEQNISFKAEEASRTVNFVEDQIQGLRKELDNSEKDLQVYKSSAGVVSLDNEARELIQKISEMEKARADVTLQKKQIEFALDALKRSMRKGTIYSPAIMRDDPLVASMASKLSELEVQKKALLNDYTENHPAVKTVQGQIEEIQRKIRSTYETHLNNLAKQQSNVTHELSLYEKRMQTLPEAERDLARLTRVSSVNAGIYTFLLQKHEEARIAKASTISNIDIVDPAIVPTHPVKPKKAQNLLLGLLFGCMLGIGLVFFQEYLDDTIKDAEEAKRVMGLPLLGAIPHINGRDPKQNITIPQGETLITQSEPKSAVAESFRSLRTNLHFTAINKQKKIMLFTSTFPGEGKSIITANEAVVISQTGARVLIIDCDLRRSSLHEKFSHSKTPGLSEILTGDTTFEKAKHISGIEGLDLITAGTTPPNPSELLGSEAMRQLLLTQRENYDYILIDAPPVLAVTDAPVLATISDIVILIMEAGRVPVKAAQHMRETLTTLQASVAGIIINDKTGKGESYGYYGSRYYRYGRRYGYGYGYGYYSDAEKKPQGKFNWWKEMIPEKLRKEIKKRFK
ncbi:MAG: polysaccharide biosynthesis tyrosine autokinase [Smithella sp.]